MQSQRGAKPENRSEGHNGFKVNIGVIPSKISHSVLVSHFSNFGKILKVFIPRKSDRKENHEAYIICADKSTFVKVLKRNEHIINGFKIECRPFENNNEFNKIKSEIESKYRILNQDKIHIRGIHRKTNDGRMCLFQML